jgi:hypothetical protein
MVPVPSLGERRKPIPGARLRAIQAAVASARRGRDHIRSQDSDASMIDQPLATAAVFYYLSHS